MRIAFAGCLAATLACFTSSPNAAPAKPDVVGVWSIGQLSHAESEVSIYELRADGTVDHLGTYYTTLRGSGPPIGTVASGVKLSCDAAYCAPTPSCTFGTKWRIAGVDRIAITSTCSDKVDRTVVVKMTPGPKFWGIDVVSVGGEKHWDHAGWDWSWQKCADRKSCLDQLRP